MHCYRRLPLTSRRALRVLQGGIVGFAVGARRRSRRILRRNCGILQGRVLRGVERKSLRGILLWVPGGILLGIVGRFTHGQDPLLVGVPSGVATKLGHIFLSFPLHPRDTSALPLSPELHSGLPISGRRSVHQFLSGLQANIPAAGPLQLEDVSAERGHQRHEGKDDGGGADPRGHARC